MAGKASGILLVMTPLPSFLGVWFKPKKEQLARVESVSFAYLLLSILCNAIWTCYAFKTTSTDLALISMIRKSLATP